MSRHLIPLGDSGWLLWRESVLRGAGFPVEWVRRLASPDLGDNPGVFEVAAERSRAALRALAADPLFLEAVTWQNPTMVGSWLRTLDPADDGELRGKKGRKRALAIASYLQRYATKNDTIGFFGPVGWARWTDDEFAVELDIGSAALARRTVYFESWAMDAVARTLSEDPELVEWIRPRRCAWCLLDGSTVYRSYGPPLRLTAEQAALLSRCDGVTTVHELGVETLPQLLAWRDARVLSLSFEGPVETRPEVRLRRRLCRVGDAPARTRALAALDELTQLRDCVAQAAGDPDRLLAAERALHDAFERITGQASKRRDGQAYAGRTLVYEDAVRGTSARLGRQLMQPLAAPLGLLLTSARWLVGRTAELYRQRLHAAYEACRDPGTDAVPFVDLLAQASPQFTAPRGFTPPVATAVAELREKWARILRVPDSARRHTVCGDAIRDLVQHEFLRSGIPWAAAVHYSPDIMLAVADRAALNAGAFVIVVGELHLAVNTMDSRPMVEQHADPAALLTANDADHAGRRIYAVPTKNSPLVNSRTYPSALLSPGYIYWCLHPNDTGAPGPILPAAGLDVVRVGERLTVRSRVDGREFDLMEVIGEHLSAAVANAFTPVPTNPHAPRIAIDRVIFQRETWTFDAATLAWAHTRSEAERFRLAGVWRSEQSMPARCFYRIPGEPKPVYVDFTAPTLVELFAKAVRAVGRSGAGAVTIAEMLPDIDATWLTDAQGASYTAELRLVVVDSEMIQGGD